jgi:hypothetical protein
VGKGSRNRRRAAAVKARRTRSGSPFWYAATGVVIIVGIVAIALSRGGNAQVAPFPNDDHWHAALGVNVCGTWLPNAPEFHERVESSGTRAGLHSHGDGLVHIHPYSSDESGNRATLGKFFEFGGWALSENRIAAWDNQEHTTGQQCDGKDAEVRWSVDGEERSGDPADYKPQDRDVIAVAFLPPGEKIGTPPSAGPTPTDVAPGESLPTPGSSDPSQSSAPPDSTDPGATPTTAAGTTETSAGETPTSVSETPTTAAAPTTSP